MVAGYGAAPAEGGCGGHDEVGVGVAGGQAVHSARGAVACTVAGSMVSREVGKRAGGGKAIAAERASSLRRGTYFVTGQHCGASGRQPNGGEHDGELGHDLQKEAGRLHIWAPSPVGVYVGWLPSIFLASVGMSPPPRPSNVYPLLLPSAARRPLPLDLHLVCPQVPPVLSLLPSPGSNSPIAADMEDTPETALHFIFV